MDNPNYVRFVVALIFVLGLLYGCLWLVQRLGPKLTTMRMRTSKTQRLKIIESLFIDPRRRLLLIERDDQQHLILLNQNQDIVIETNIPLPVSAALKDFQNDA